MFRKSSENHVIYLLLVGAIILTTNNQNTHFHLIHIDTNLRLVQVFNSLAFACEVLHGIINGTRK
jgi:hypothetical protein